MRANSNYIFRQVADEYLLIPVGEAALSVKGLIRLSESGCLLFQKLQNECSREELVDAILGEYDVPRDVADQDVDAFLAQLRRFGILVED